MSFGDQISNIQKMKTSIAASIIIISLFVILHQSKFLIISKKYWLFQKNFLSNLFCNTKDQALKCFMGIGNDYKNISCPNKANSCSKSVDCKNRNIINSGFAKV